ncbi:3-ketoacyl-CoA thiolase, partial [Metarhizium brunneum ARSEF 3297]
MASPRGVANILAKSPADVVILSSVRTPVTRAYKGGLKDAYPEELLACVLKHVRERSVPGTDLGALIEDVGVGVVLSELGGSKAARAAMNHVGYPSSTALFTVNRACSSSLQAVAAVAGEIRGGMARVAVAAGMESMTRNYAAKVGAEQRLTVARDDGIRENVSVEALARLKPAFKPGGASTAGNSSQVSDGAAATLLMSRGTATRLGLSDRIIGKFVSAAVVGCAPDEMGIGPALAIPKLLASHGLAVGDVDRWEINEAFASQALYCLRKLGLEDAWAAGRVNPTGGAIALGHPLGATGARMTSTLVHGMRRDGHDLGVVSMCVGTGMGMAGLFAREA